MNRVKDELNVTVDCSARDERALPQTFVDYEENPREYLLSAVNTVLDVHTRVSDLYSVPHDQVTEQLRLTIEIIKERQESELINNTEYGLLHNISASQRIKPRTGPPTPDDLDELLAKVWKERGFFLLHPRAIAAFGRECTRREVPPPTLSMFGSILCAGRFQNRGIGAALNREGIAVRSGHHCAQTILRRFGPESTSAPFPRVL